MSKERDRLLASQGLDTRNPLVAEALRSVQFKDIPEGATSVEIAKINQDNQRALESLMGNIDTLGKQERYKNSDALFSALNGAENIRKIIKANEAYKSALKMPNRPYIESYRLPDRPDTARVDAMSNDLYRQGAGDATNRNIQELISSLPQERGYGLGQQGQKALAQLNRGNIADAILKGSMANQQARNEAIKYAMANSQMDNAYKQSVAQYNKMSTDLTNQIRGGEKSDKAASLANAQANLNNAIPELSENIANAYLKFGANKNIFGSPKTSSQSTATSPNTTTPSEPYNPNWKEWGQSMNYAAGAIGGANPFRGANPEFEQDAIVQPPIELQGTDSEYVDLYNSDGRPISNNMPLLPKYEPLNLSPVSRNFKIPANNTKPFGDYRLLDTKRRLPGLPGVGMSSFLFGNNQSYGAPKFAPNTVEFRNDDPYNAYLQPTPYYGIPSEQPF